MISALKPGVFKIFSKTTLLNPGNKVKTAREESSFLLKTGNDNGKGKMAFSLNSMFTPASASTG